VRLIEGLDWKPAGTEWAEYGTASSYDEAGARAKDEIVSELLTAAGPPVVWDLGANNGRYSAIAARVAQRVLSLDIDPAASERHWRDLAAAGTMNVLPLLQDLANPSPAIGWDARERRSLFKRAEGATLLALALVHHLAIGRNVPLPMLSATLARLGDRLIIEWVPKDDPMVRRLLATREDVFPDYTATSLETALSAHWRIQRMLRLGDTPRTIYEATRR
jgi:hypothetical protein